MTGDIILATNAAGTINVDGIQVIDGNFASESCSSNCPSFTSLSSSTLVSVSQNMSLQSLPGLISVSLPELETVGDQFYLDALPNLQNLSIHALSSVGQFHLGSAPKLFTMNLTGLRYVTGQEASITVVSVGLASVAGLNINTNLSTFILRDNPYMNELSLSTPRIDYLEISGNMSAAISSLSTSAGQKFISNIGTLNISSCYAFLAPPSNTTIDNIILAGNTFKPVILNEVNVVNNLTIVDNPLLSQATLPTDMSIQNIEIRGNGNLYDERDVTLLDGLIAGNGSWPWGMEKASSMVFDGNFDSYFL